MTALTKSVSPKSGGESIPSINQLYFYLTEGCNLACRHCWLAPKFDPNANRYPVLPVKLFETAIREAKPLGLSGVKLTGGEPLMHPEITKLLEIVRREELALTIETNGMLCTPEMASEIAMSPQRFVSVSMDGADAATHEWVRGVEGSFEQTQQAVRNLAAVDTPPQIIMSLMRCNANQVEAMVRLAADLGASSVKFNIVQPTGRGENIHEGSNGLDVAELIELGHYIDSELSSRTQVLLSFDYPMAFRPLSRIASRKSGGFCGIMGILGVIPSGHYALCGIGEHISELVFGKVGEDPLLEVWHENTTLKNLRSGMPEQLTGICAECLMKHRCLGTCIAQNYYSTGNLWAPFWFCNQANEIGLFPASRISKVMVLLKN